MISEVLATQMKLRPLLILHLGSIEHQKSVSLIRLIAFSLWGLFGFPEICCIREINQYSWCIYDQTIAQIAYYLLTRHLFICSIKIASSPSITDIIDFLKYCVTKNLFQSWVTDTTTTQTCGRSELPYTNYTQGKLCSRYVML